MGQGRCTAGRRAPWACKGRITAHWALLYTSRWPHHALGPAHTERRTHCHVHCTTDPALAAPHRLLYQVRTHDTVNSEHVVVVALCISELSNASGEVL